jgi:hypothetical protein
MTEAERGFLEAYYKAAETSQPEDWLSAALRAKQMYNATRNPEDQAQENAIQEAAKEHRTNK